MATEPALEGYPSPEEYTTEKPLKFMSAADALKASQRTFARVNIPFIASQMGVTEKAALFALSDAVFLDPYTMEYQSAEEYLSGNLYHKLEIATKVNDATGRFGRNVAALKKAVPPNVSAEAIYVTLGAPWIPEDVIGDFVSHLMNTPFYDCVVVHDPTTGSWEIKNKSCYNYRPEARRIWGTNRVPAPSILESTLNGREIRVKDEEDCEDTISGKRLVLNYDETLLALEKQRAIQNEFKSWVWRNPERKDRLVGLYNERFCGWKPRRYDGGILEFPGLSNDVRLRPYQKNAAMRILQECNVLVAHDVGAGKTYTAIAAIMELRRMGISQKNLVVVPNNVLVQWSSLFAQMYPHAKVLVITPKDFIPVKRQAVLRSIRDEDYDAIIMAYSSFDLIPLSRKTELDTLDRRIRELSKIMGDPTRCTSAVKREYTACRKKREKLANEAKKDEGVTFDQLDVTRLFVDEAHTFKNLSLGGERLRIYGFGRRGSAKCRHMHDAIRCVQRAGGGAVFLSGTIITNSIVDLFVIQTYLQPDTLELLGLRSFDAWANMFARKVTGFEIDVDTSTYHHVTRFGGFGNLAELASILSDICDFHHLGPADGLPEYDGRKDVLIRKSRHLDAYLKCISIRAERVRSGQVHSRYDNLLKICSDARKAAIDVRLVDEETGSEGSKVQACAGLVYRIWLDSTAQRLTQIVFCDTSTPKNSFNVYSELKSLLVAMGVPEHEVAFVHDAKTDAQRGRLFAAVRAGEVRVLVGSTPKLGIGVNVQDRLVAAHHLDVPWRPADMTQRRGRILRQGNRNKYVREYAYVTEGSFDAYSWQILENKQRVIDELLAGTCEKRFLEHDVGDEALSYAEVKALAVNNPLLKERMEVSNELERNLILQRRTATMREEMQDEIKTKMTAISHLEDEATRCRKDVAYLEIMDYCRPERSERTRLRSAVMQAISQNAFFPRDRIFPGHYRGFTIVLPKDMDPEKPYLWLSHSARHRVDLCDAKELGVIVRMDNVLDKISNRIEDIDEKIAELYRSWEVLDAELASKASDRSKQIRECREHLARIDMELEQANERKLS